MNNTRIVILKTLGSHSRGWPAEEHEQKLRSIGYDACTTTVLHKSELERCVASEPNAIFWPTFFSLQDSDVSVHEILEASESQFIGAGAKTCEMHDKREFYSLLRSKSRTAPMWIESSRVTRTTPMPLVIKPARDGYSRGVHLVPTFAHYEHLAASGNIYEKNQIAQPYLAGDEFTVAYLPASRAQPQDRIFPLHISFANPSDKIITLEAKSDDSRLIFRMPEADIVRDLQRETQGIVDALGIDGHCRIDFRESNGSLFPIDLNLVPFLRRSNDTTSYFLRAADLYGAGDFQALASAIIDHGLDRGCRI